MNLKKIPDDLRLLPQWVCCWKNSKIPMQAVKTKAASASDPTTWSTYREAEEAVQHGYYDYLGFVFNGNGLVGIDLDKGFSDGLLTEQAAKIMKLCSSYTEKSKSGRGIHIILRGTLPFKGKNNRDGVEIYQSNRFFIITGDQMVFPNIVENQTAIDSILEAYFPETDREQTGSFTHRIYSPIYPPVKEGDIPLRPIYPEIPQGGRNISLTSLAGQLHTQGYSSPEIYRELLTANEEACKPPLPQREIESIVNSITRYRR